MKNKVKHIIENFNSGILKFENEEKEYCLTIKKDFVGSRLHIKYLLETENSKVGRVSIYYSFNDDDNKNKWNALGYSEVPESMFEIDNLYIEPKFRNAGIGTMLLDVVMSDIINFDTTQNLNSKIVLIRLNTPDATAFFNKWNARNNDNLFKDNSSTVRMIIDTPQITSTKNFVKIKTPPIFQQ